MGSNQVAGGPAAMHHPQSAGGHMGAGGHMYGEERMMTGGGGALHLTKGGKQKKLVGAAVPGRPDMIIGKLGKRRYGSWLLLYLFGYYCIN